MIRNIDGQIAGAQVTDLSGAPFTGPGIVNVYVIGDGGIRTLGQNGGIAETEGAGYYTYRPTADETNFATVGFQFVAVDAVTTTVTYDTFTVEQERAINAVTATGLGAMTCRDLLMAALRRIGVLAQGITVQAETLEQSLIAFNSYIDALAANRLMIYGETRTTWPLVSGQQDYLVGPLQDVDRARPVYVEQLGTVSPLRYIDTNNDNLEVPLTLLTTQQWRAVSLKAMTSSLPSAAYYNATYPFSTISLWQVPRSNSLLGVLYAPTALTEYRYDDIISLPPGYRRFLITNLAMELCAEFERKPPPSLPELAAQAKADVERSNITLIDMATDPMWAIGSRAGVYNIYSDTPTR